MDQRRNRMRWRGFNYGSPGQYYITLCTQGRRCLFGRVSNGQMQLNAAGRMVVDVWRCIPQAFAQVELGDFVLMPNHMHGIILLLDAAPRPRLGTVVQWFKYRTTLEYGKGVRTLGWPRFDRRLWQRNYHDRVLRNEDERAHAAGYIWRNPRTWREDRYHPRAP